MYRLQTTTSHEYFNLRIMEIGVRIESGKRSKRVGSFLTHLVQTRLTRLLDFNESVTKNDK